MPSPVPPIDSWDNFYVIIGSSAAGLTGLTFVVIALASDAMQLRMWGLRTFVTPVVMHFGSALWLSALLCVPGQTAVSLAACMLVSGAILGLYGGATVYRMYRSRKEYRPVIEDWIWNATLPLLCYLALLVAGVWLLRQPAAALYFVGASALALLFIGIHNVWDLAVWITIERPSVQEQQKKAAEAAASASGTSSSASAASAAAVGEAVSDPHDSSANLRGAPGGA
jgi:hypothetical protein